jgi:hypothetical protein
MQGHKGVNEDVSSTFVGWRAFNPHLAFQKGNLQRKRALRLIPGATHKAMQLTE